MAISFSGSAEGSATAVMPAHTAGDLLLLWVFRDGSAVLPTAVGGWTIIASPTGTSCCAILAYKIAASDTELVGTWTNGTSLVVGVYPGVDNADPIGGFATAVGTTNSGFNIPAVTLDHTDGTSWINCGAGHRSTDTDIETPPTGTVLRQDRLNGTSEATLFDTNGGVSSWPIFSRTITGTASGWNTYAVELNASTQEVIPMTLTVAGDTVTYSRGGATSLAEVVVTTQSNEYPVGATVLNPSSGNVAAAVATATLTSAASQTAYITGFEVTGAGATAGVAVSVTVTGLLGGTATYTYTAATGAAVPNQPLIVAFFPPLPASAANTNIVVSCPSLGAGNTNNTVTAHGYRR